MPREAGGVRAGKEGGMLSTNNLPLPGVQCMACATLTARRPVQLCPPMMNNNKWSVVYRADIHGKMRHER